jgi:hypothetical protein
LTVRCPAFAGFPADFRGGLSRVIHRVFSF